MPKKAFTIAEVIVATCLAILVGLAVFQLREQGRSFLKNNSEKVEKNALLDSLGGYARIIDPPPIGASFYFSGSAGRVSATTDMTSRTGFFAGTSYSGAFSHENKVIGESDFFGVHLSLIQVRLHDITNDTDAVMYSIR